MTPPIPVPAGVNVPLGAGSNFDTKLFLLPLASTMASARRAAALFGTVERKPIRGGSREGRVRLP